MGNSTVDGSHKYTSYIYKSCTIHIVLDDSPFLLEGSLDLGFREQCSANALSHILELTATT